MHGDHGETAGAGGVRLPVGARLAGRYRVVGWLGAGGMGAVYEVLDEALNERAALKLLHASLSAMPEARDRIRSEVRLARRVSHPNVCRVHDIGQHDGRLFITMERIEGGSLRDRLADGSYAAVPLARKLDAINQICAGLAAAHRAGVLHRDVKPDNVIAGDVRVVLTDFGIAHAGAGGPSARVAGTPAYIAPEVLRGEPYDARADVYAAAVLAYELFAGDLPFYTPSLDAAIARARARRPPGPPPLPRGAAPPIARAALDRVFARALASSPHDRPDTADALAEEIARAARGDGADSGPRVLAAAPAVSAAAARQTTVLAPLVPDGAPSVRAPAAAPPTRTGEVRVATALCAALGRETEPDDVERIVVDLGGTPQSDDRGEFVALFGAPIAYGDDAARAARAAFELLRAGAERVGIDTGRILLRAVATGTTATGDALDRARRLANAAGPGQVFASPAAARHLVGRFDARDVPDGVAGDRALALSPTTDDRLPRDRPALVGRDRELDLLSRALDDAFASHSPRFVTLLGETGAGKSRLRLELVDRAAARREIDWLVARATPLGEVAPLSMLAHAHREWVRAATADGVDNRAAVVAAARRWLELRAARRPVGLVLEDVQWADDASLAVFEHLRRTLDQVPVFCLALARPALCERAPTWCADGPDAARHTVVRLSPLRDRDAESIARHVAPNATRDAVRDVVARAGGNPFFVEELVRELSERDAQSGAGLPETVEAAIQARLDRLPPRARDVVRAAAVVGREFWRDACRAALGIDARNEAVLDDALAELERRAMAFPLPPEAIDDDRYAFRSALVRDVAYRQIPPRERRRLHAAVASWLRQHRQAQPRDASHMAAIAQHLDAAGERADAAAAYRAAGERSLSLFAYGDAARLLRRAAELTDEPDADLLESIGDALSQADSIADGERAYRDALAQRGDAPVARARLSAKLGRCARQRGSARDAIDWFERGIAALADAGADPVVAADLYGGLGWIYGYWLGDSDRGVAYGERAVALLDGHPQFARALARALSSLGASYMRAGRYRDQLRCNRRNLDIAVELGDLTSQVGAHCNLGIVLWTLGDIDAAMDHTRRGLALAIRTGAAGTAALLRNNLAGLLLEAGRLEEARAELDESLRLAERTGNRNFLSEAHVFSARLRVADGDLAGAERDALRAVDLAAEAASAVDEGIAWRVAGAVRARRGAFDSAGDAFRRAHALLAGADPYEHARTLAAEARALRARGDRDAAEARARAARAAFDRLGIARERDLVDDPDAVR